MVPPAAKAACAAERSNSRWNRDGIQAVVACPSRITALADIRKGPSMARRDQHQTAVTARPPPSLAIVRSSRYRNRIAATASGGSAINRQAARQSSSPDTAIAGRAMTPSSTPASMIPALRPRAEPAVSQDSDPANPPRLRSIISDAAQGAKAACPSPTSTRLTTSPSIVVARAKPIAPAVQTRIHRAMVR